MHYLTKSILVAFAAIAAPAVAMADTYTLANFSGGIFGGNANAQVPFDAAGITQGMLLSGSFLIDDNIVPGPGFDNVLFSSYPDAAVIPDSVEFNFNIGSLNFTSAGAALAGIQYNNGNFNGFAYSKDFSFQNVAYNLTISGGTFSIKDMAPQPQQFVSGYINIGNGGVTGRTPYVPPVVVGPGVPEPATWAMMILGMGAVGATLRRRRTVATFA